MQKAIVEIDTRLSEVPKLLQNRDKDRSSGLAGLLCTHSNASNPAFHFTIPSRCVKITPAYAGQGLSALSLLSFYFTCDTEVGVLTPSSGKYLSLNSFPVPSLS